MNCDPATLARAAACYCFDDRVFGEVALLLDCLAAGGTEPPHPPPTEGVFLGAPTENQVFGDPVTGDAFGEP